MRSMLKSEKSMDMELSRSRFGNNRQNLATEYGKKQQNSFEQVIETLNIYLRSAIDLKNNLSLGRNNSFNDGSIHARNKIDNNQELALVLTKVQFFIKSCQTQLKQINKTIENASVSQIQSMGQNYHKVLLFIKDKYAQLLKEAYRTLNLESIQSDNVLTEDDKRIVKQNRKRKLKQINQLEKQMDALWTTGLQLNQISDLSQISFDGGRNQHPNNNDISFGGNNDGKEIRKSGQNASKSFMVTLEQGKFKKARRLQVLGLDIEGLNLRQLAKQELQKQFLSIRVQAYNMYERYMSHEHKEVKQSLRFLGQEQQILHSQVQQEANISREMRQEYERLVRELSEIRTINQLIRRRYVLRESIRMESEETLYQ